jgi:hypothetical protein
VLLEHCQKLGLLLVCQQAKGDRRDQMVTTLGPCVDGLGWKQQKKNQNQTQ